MSQQRADDYSNALTSLVDSISSSSLSDAQKYLALVRQYSTGQEVANTPLARFISSVSTALGNNDMASAQDALAGLKSHLTSSQQYETSIAESYTGTVSTEDSTWAQSVLGLAQAINSNDLGQAMVSYGLLAQSYSAVASQDYGANYSSSSADAQTTAQLQKISESLNTGNISSAQMALDGFPTSLSAGSIVKAKA